MIISLRVLEKESCLGHLASKRKSLDLNSNLPYSQTHTYICIWHKYLHVHIYTYAHIFISTHKHTYIYIVKYGVFSFWSSLVEEWGFQQFHVTDSSTSFRFQNACIVFHLIYIFLFVCLFQIVYHSARVAMKCTIDHCGLTNTSWHSISSGN